MRSVTSVAESLHTFENWFKYAIQERTTYGLSGAFSACRHLKELRETMGGAERVMVGRDRDKTAVVRLADAKGKPRIKLSVDATGAPKLEFLDETGKVTYSLPQDSKADKK